MRVRTAAYAWVVPGQWCAQRDRFGVLSTRDRHEDLHAEYVMLGAEQVGVARFDRAGIPSR